MQTEQNILQVFKQLLEQTKQFYSREASIPERQTAIEHEFEKLNEALNDAESQELLDRIFDKLSEWSQDLPNETTRDILKYRMHELEKIEIKIKRYVPIKDKDLKWALNAARLHILKKGKDAKDVLPMSYAELQAQFSGLAKESTTTLAESKTYSRKKKKESRQQMLRRLGLAAMGAILAFGNVLLAMQSNLPVETSQASITAGAGCLTAAALKKAE